uniref:hypothetical protein n=1 Tax=Gemmiger formicilis TaxID=745368 RepID=UPI004029F4E0
MEFVFIKKTPFVQCGRALWAHYKSSAYYHNILCVRWLDYFWKISEPGTAASRKVVLSFGSKRKNQRK